jgi:formate dehydrogenase iron-sulfur subunit
MVACKQWKCLPAEITPFEGDFQSHKDLSSKTYNLIKMKESMENNKFRWLFIKFQCMHCGEPGCVKACPVGALKKNPEGPVTYDEDLCIGCKYCETGCPFSVPHVDVETEKVTKCNLCAERIEEGMVPSCAKTCTADAIKFGSRADMVALAERSLAALKNEKDENGEALYPNAQLYGVDETDGIKGTSMIYVLTDRPALFGLPENPTISPALNLWKGAVHTGGKVLVGAAAVAVAGAMVMTAVKGKDEGGHE